MANPTWAEITAQLSAMILFFEDLRRFGNVTATHNVVSLLDAIEQIGEGDYLRERQALMARTRAAYASAFALAPDWFMTGLLDAAKLIGVSDTDPQGILTKLIQWMKDNAKSVNSREFTFPACSAGGGNVGTGSLLRLNVDADNAELENQWAEAKQAKCIADMNSGSYTGEEIFEFTGTTPGRDSVEFMSGSGLVQNINSVSPRIGSGSLLLNSGFRTITGDAAAPSDLTNWVASVAVSAATFQLDTAHYYRTFQGDTTPSSLVILTSSNVSQKLSLRNTALSPFVPYVLQVAYNAEVNTATGDLKLEIGSKSATVTVDGLTGWKILRVALSQNCWLKNFDANDLTVKLTWTKTSGPAADILIGEVIFAPMVNFGGGWYLPIGGATPWLRDDVFTWTDSAVDAGVVQRELFFRRFGRTAPYKKDGSETWVDPI